MKNNTQAFHPTPVRSAILNIRLIVPRSLTPVFSKVSLIWLANVLESLISSPIAIVKDFSCETFWDRIVVAVTSFWASSSSSTEVEYWPFELGVAERKLGVESWTAVSFVLEYGLR